MLNPLLSVRLARIKGKLTGLTVEDVGNEKKTSLPEGDFKSDFFETMNGYVKRIDAVEFRTLTDPDEFYIRPVFLLYASENPDFIEKAVKKEPKIMDYLNKELERFGYYPVSNVVEFKALFTPDEKEILRKKVEEINEKEMIPFFGFPLTHEYAVSLIIRRLGELYGIKPKIRTLPLKKEEVNVPKELLTSFTLEDVRKCQNFFKKRNVIACLLEVLSRKKGGKELLKVLEENRQTFEFPLTITEVLYG